MLRIAVFWLEFLWINKKGSVLFQTKIASTVTGVLIWAKKNVIYLLKFGDVKICHIMQLLLMSRNVKKNR